MPSTSVWSAPLRRPRKPVPQRANRIDTRRASCREIRGGNCRNRQDDHRPPMLAGSSYGTAQKWSRRFQRSESSCRGRVPGTGRGRPRCSYGVTVIARARLLFVSLLSAATLVASASAMT